MFRYLNSTSSHESYDVPYLKYGEMDMLRLYQMNSVSSIMDEMCRFYTIYPDSKVFTPESFGLSWSDIYTVLSNYIDESIRQELKRWNPGSFFLWDEYFKHKFPKAKWWQCPSTFIAIAIYLLYAVILCCAPGMDFAAVLGLLLCSIPALGIIFFLTAFAVQFSLILIQKIIIRQRIKRLEKIFQATDVYTIYRAQQRYIANLKN